jgi:hypothetical protein
MNPIGKKPAASDHESSLKIILAKLFLARCPCAFPVKEDWGGGLGVLQYIKL